MKGLFSIILAVSLLGWSCSDNEDVLPNQQSQFVTFLTSKHDPLLLSEQQKAASQDKNPEFYITRGDSVYRYIKNYYDPVRRQYPEVAYGDRVTLTFRMYEFNFQPIVSPGEAETITMPYYSNDPLLEETYKLSGLTVPGVWKFEPLEIELGRTEILKGLEFALPGCRERDTVEVYMSYNMAYGEGPLGIIPKQTPIAVFFSVDEVAKN